MTLWGMTIPMAQCCDAAPAGLEIYGSKTMNHANPNTSQIGEAFERLTSMLPIDGTVLGKRGSYDPWLLSAPGWRD